MEQSCIVLPESLCDNIIIEIQVQAIMKYFLMKEKKTNPLSLYSRGTGKIWSALPTKATLLTDLLYHRFKIFHYKIETLPYQRD